LPAEAASEASDEHLACQPKLRAERAMSIWLASRSCEQSERLA
jgi:hypothetical protein